MGKVSTNRLNFGMSHRPTAEATTRNRIILNRIKVALVTPPAPSPPRKAKKRDRPKTPRESSTTAALSIVTPTLLRNFPSSIKVCAAMLMLVGAITKPIKSARSGAKEKAVPRINPSATANTNPRKPTQTATLPDSARSERRRWRPATNISNKTPSSAKISTVSPKCGSVNRGQCKKSSTDGPRIRPTSTSPTTAGCPNR